MHRKSAALQSVVIQLGVATSGKPPATLGRALHALVLQWLHLGNSEVAEKIHTAQVSPFSVSGLLGHRRPQGNQPGDLFYFRVGILSETLIQPLLRGLEQWGTKPLSLGKFPFVIRSIYALSGTHHLADTTDYHLLSKSLPLSQPIKLQFLSPTSFKQQQHIQTFPLPELVFGSLHRKWNTFAPVQLHFPPVTWQGLVSAYELKTHALKLKSGAEIGCQGWVRYHFSEPEQAKIAHILAQFAFFAGVGRKTTMGMGQTQLLNVKRHLTPSQR